MLKFELNVKNIFNMFPFLHLVTSEQLWVFSFDHDMTGTASPSSHVNPGAIFSYEWDVPEAASPTQEDPDCLTWIYYSASDSIKDTNAGLVGPLLVCKKGSLLPSGKQVMQSILNSSMLRQFILFI